MDFPSQDTFDPRFGRYYEGREVFSRRFLLRRLLGVGGMGQVWLAEDRHLGEEVALKFTMSEVVGDTKAVADLRRVVSQTRELTHPNIVRTYDFHVEGNEAAISMEFMPGKNLSEWQEKTPHGFFEPEEILPWLRTLCEVMDYAHQQAGRTHRDLKPKNLMWDAERGVLKVADFDIGRRITDTVSRNTGKEPSGSFPYMSPQQLLGERSVAQDDIYSIGATIYELLTGTPPFFSGDVREQIRLIVPPFMGVRRRDNHHDGLIASMGNEIPTAWENAIAGCLGKDREKRPASAAALLAMLQAPSPVAKPAKSLKPRKSSKEKSKSSRAFWFSLAACVVLSIIAWGITQQGRDRIPSGPTENASHLAELQQERDRTTVAENLAEETRQKAFAAQKVADEEKHKREAMAAEATRKEEQEAQRVAAAKAAEEAAIKKMLARASKEKPFENSLGMKFVPVPITSGPSKDKKILFSIWETRRKDYEAFANANSGVNGEWKDLSDDDDLPINLDPDHPVVNMSCNDAMAFCKWLTRNERAAGKIGERDEYRLPTDAEWSYAVGIGSLEDESLPPSAKFSQAIPDRYPWGSKWTPVGNYSDDGRWGKAGMCIPKYFDGYQTTAPVGSFACNTLGIYDLGGNVQEWTSSGWHSNDSSGESCCLRGSSWQDSIPQRILSSARQNWARGVGTKYLGFRCVLAVYAMTEQQTKDVDTETTAEAVATAKNTPITTSKAKPFENSLGMKFVPIGIQTGGKTVVFSIWETRWTDYEVYANANANSGVDAESQKPVFEQTGEHPMVNVSYDDAVAFCAWLTKKERASEMIGAADEYRLPTDAEWSYAVGIGEQEDASKAPKEKDGKIEKVWPWGTNWPPPKGAGNYCGQETKGKFGSMIDGYDDGFATTSPVGSFRANSFGLYDMGGNIWEWCGTCIIGQSKARVVRGGSWEFDDRLNLLSSIREGFPPDYCDDGLGFRCVLVVSGQ